MADTFAKTVECVLCEQTFSPVFEPGEDEEGYEISCSACSRRVLMTRGDSVRVALREVLNLQGEALALAVQTYLAPCPCGRPFSHDAGRRCPVCLKKIRKEASYETRNSGEFRCLWNLEKMKKELEGKLFAYILDQMDSEAETLNHLVEAYESGQMDPGTYMVRLEELRFREAREVAVIKTWAMLVGPEMAFRAADEHALTARYGSRILISIASGLELGYGKSILSTLSREEKNLDGPTRKEIQTFIKKIAGGF